MNLSHCLIAIASALLVGAWLHEGSHYLVGWIGKTGPRMEFTLCIFPKAVSHTHIKTMDSELIRMSGISIFVWIPVGLLALALFVLNQTPAYLFLAFTPVVILGMATESDAIAARNPEKYRVMEINDEFDQKSLFFSGFWRKIS